MKFKFRILAKNLLGPLFEVLKKKIIFHQKIYDVYFKRHNLPFLIRVSVCFAIFVLTDYY
jgi:hypothetical protein